ncbi:MAG: hypothetical protein H0X05_00780 [Actinobacteria bacterium]|nr:hypothetical protein [Actinomycetota bacterium]
MRQQLGDFILLVPLLFLPVRNADLGSTMTADLAPPDTSNGSLRRLVIFLVRRVRTVTRLFAPRTASEMHVIAAAAKAEAKTTRRPARRRRASRATTLRTLPASPRVRPQTT